MVPHDRGGALDLGRPQPAAPAGRANLRVADGGKAGGEAGGEGGGRRVAARERPPGLGSGAVSGGRRDPRPGGVDGAGGAQIAQRPDHLSDAARVIAQDTAACLEPAGIDGMVGPRAEMLTGVPKIDNFSLGRVSLQEGPVGEGAPRLRGSGPRRRGRKPCRRQPPAGVVAPVLAGARRDYDAVERGKGPLLPEAPQPLRETLQRARLRFSPAAHLAAVNLNSQAQPEGMGCPHHRLFSDRLTRRISGRR